jgi:hypothetical protein
MSVGVRPKVSVGMRQTLASEASVTSAAPVGPTYCAWFWTAVMCA